jgi:hypothetical protein
MDVSVSGPTMHSTEFVMRMFNEARFFNRNVIILRLQ